MKLLRINERLRGGFCWPLVFDYSLSIFDKICLILVKLSTREKNVHMK